MQSSNFGILPSFELPETISRRKSATYSQKLSAQSIQRKKLYQNWLMHEWLIVVPDRLVVVSEWHDVVSVTGSVIWVTGCGIRVTCGISDWLWYRIATMYVFRSKWSHRISQTSFVLSMLQIIFLFVCVKLPMTAMFFVGSTQNEESL